MPTIDIVLLGGAGFVGAAILREVAKSDKNRSVKAVVRGHVANKRYLDEVVCNIGDVESSWFPKRPFVVLHFASKQTDPHRVGFSDNLSELNKLLSNLSTNPYLRGIIYGSSASTINIRSSKQPKLAPLTVSRLECEERIVSFCTRKGISGLILQPRFVVGHGDRFTLPKLIKLTKLGITFGTGSQKISFLDVDHYAQIVLSLADSIESKDIIGVDRCHVGYAKRLSLYEIQVELAKCVNVRPPKWHLPVLKECKIRNFLTKIRLFKGLLDGMNLLGQNHDYPIDIVKNMASEFNFDLDSRDALNKSIKNWQSSNNLEEITRK